MDTLELNALHAVRDGHCPAPARAASLAAATDPRLRETIEENRIELIGYKALAQTA